MPLTLFDTLGHSLSSSDDKRRAAEARASSVAYPLSDPKRPTLSDSAYPLSDPKRDARETGRRGGEARKASLSPERRHEIAVLANRARRAKKV